jgi:hypothetical protein
MYKFEGGSKTLSTPANTLDVVEGQYDAADNTITCVLRKAFS